MSRTKLRPEKVALVPLGGSIVLRDAIANQKVQHGAFGHCIEIDGLTHAGKRSVIPRE